MGAGAALAPSPGAGPDLSPTETSVPFNCGNRAPSPCCLVLKRAQYTRSFTSDHCFAFFSYMKFNLHLWLPPRSQHAWPTGTIPARLPTVPSSSQGPSPAEPTPTSHLACACALVTTPPPLQLLCPGWVSPPPGSTPGCPQGLSHCPHSDHGCSSSVSLGWPAGVPSSWLGVWPQHSLSTEQTLHK